MLNRVATAPTSLEGYRGLISEELYSSIVERAAGLAGLRVAHINATPEGGGVAEMLKSLVPLQQGIGLDAAWYIMPPDDEFFKITKQFHNCLQGKNGSLPPADFARYLRHNVLTANLMKQIDVDVWVIHDPQPLAAAFFLDDFHPVIWRCHIDTSTPNPEVRDFVLPFIRYYDQVIFSMPEYAFPQLSPDKTRFFPPAIDALTTKNRPLPRPDARQRLGELGLDPARPIVTQVSRFDPWKDPWGVIDAYRLAKQEISGLQLALVGVIAAQDDPEAYGIVEEVRHYAGNDPDIHLYVDPAQVGAPEVNAFQAGSDVIVQKSIREGFGLTVTEAMWKGTPVIGGDCGGIRLQINEGNNGCLVRGADSCAEKIVGLLSDQALAMRLGEAGRETVRQHYLLPRLLLNYLDLLTTVTSTRLTSAA